jgi:hypothetical protein
VIITNDIEKLKDYYKSVLHQEIEFDFGNCVVFKCGLSIWKLKPDYPIVKHLGGTYNNSGNKNMELCFDTDQFETVVEELKKHNINLLHDIVEETWGQRTLRFCDPENNLIEIGESMICFATRLLKQGKTPEEVANKTSIPLDTVLKYSENK